MRDIEFQAPILHLPDIGAVGILSGGGNALQFLFTVADDRQFSALIGLELHGDLKNTVLQDPVPFTIEGQGSKSPVKGSDTVIRFLCVALLQLFHSEDAPVNAVHLPIVAILHSSIYGQLDTAVPLFLPGIGMGRILSCLIRTAGCQEYEAQRH